MEPLGNEIRATAKEGPVALEQLERGNARLAQLWERSGKDQRGSFGQDSNGSLGGSSPENPSITISVIEGPSKGLMHEMRQSCITLGRTGGGADFQFNEPKASDLQCIIATRENGVCLYDASSLNGTYVDNRRIAAADLTNMSTFRVGSSLLLVKVQPSQPAGIC